MKPKPETKVRTKTYRIPETEDDFNNELCELFHISDTQLYRLNMFYPSPIEAAACFEIVQSCIRIEKKQDDFIRIFSENIIRNSKPFDRESLQKQLNEINEVFQVQLKEVGEIKTSICDLIHELKIKDIEDKKDVKKKSEISLSEDVSEDSSEKEDLKEESSGTDKLASEYAKYADVF